MSQIFKASTGGGGGAVSSVTGAHGLTAIPTTGAVVVSGVNATTSTVGVASFNPADFTVASGAVSLTAAIANRFPITPYVVGPIGQAGYQTIQSAMDAANAAGGGAVYIQTGSYTENLIFYPDVSLVGVTANSDETAVGTDITITGTHTPAATGYTSISGIYLESTGDIFFSTNAGTCDIALQNCNIGITGSGYTFNLVNWTGQLNKFDVQDNSANNGVVNNTAGAKCFFQNSNMGFGNANSMITSGQVTMKRVHMQAPWIAGSGTFIIADFSTFIYLVTINGTAGGEFNFCRFSPSTFSSDPGVIWNSTTLLELEMCIVDSTGTYAIDGTGTGSLIIGSVGFVQSTGINPTVTLVALGGFIPNAFGTAGQVWTSNGQGVVPTFQSASGGGIVTIDGDSGSVTGSTVTIYADNAANNCGSTVKFVNSGTISTLNVTHPTNDSTFIGNEAGNLTASGNFNTALGQAAMSNATTDHDNVAVGYAAMVNCVGNVSNVAIGSFAMQNTRGGSNITAVGYGTLQKVTGGGNVALGSLGLFELTTGTSNIGIGYEAGSNYTSSESSNIAINAFATCVTGESNVGRIGDGTGTGDKQLAAMYISGITGVTVTGTAVLCATNGQLGTVASSARYKENIQDMAEDVSIMHLRPVEFNYKSDKSRTKQYGLIAEDVNQSFPYLCFYGSDGSPESVKYHELPVLLLKEIQRLTKRIEALESR